MKINQLKMVTTDIIKDILDLRNRAWVDKELDFAQEVKNIVKKYDNILGKLRKTIPSDYKDFNLFMNAFYQCIHNGILYVIETNRVVIQKNNYKLKIGNKVTYEEDDKDNQLSFYIKQNTYYTERYHNKSHEYRNPKNHRIITKEDVDEAKKIVDVQDQFYRQILTIGIFSTECNNEYVQDLKFTGCNSFLDVVRQAFIYNHLIYDGFHNIGVCKHPECTNFYYSTRIAGQRGHFCSQKCYKNNPRRDKNLEQCQNRMRNYFIRKLEQASNHAKSDIFSNKKVSIATADCKKCRYISNPANAAKGDCYQLLRDPDLSQALDIVEQAKHKKASKRKPFTP